MSDRFWLPEYEHLMFGKDATLQSIDEAAQIKALHMPETLYKYRSCNKHAFEALENDFLFSSSPSEFNDLFEGSIIINREKVFQNTVQKVYDKLRLEHPYLPNTFVSSYVDLANIIANTFENPTAIYEDPAFLNTADNLNRAMISGSNKLIESLQHNARNSYNVICFCEEYDNPVMWAHYSDNNKGFCIGYDVKRRNDNLRHLTFPVIYRDEIKLEIEDLDGLNASDNMHMLTIKSPAWSYEKEWRTLFPPNPPCNKEKMPKAKCVYMGANISDDNTEKIDMICKKKGIALYAMNVDISKSKYVATPVYIP